FEALAGALEEVTASHPDDPASQLTEAGVAYVLLAVREPQRAQLMFGGSLDFDATGAPLQSTGQSAFNALVEIIAAGQRVGVHTLRVPRRAALSAWARAHGLAMLVIAGRIEEAESEERVVAFTREAGRRYRSGLLLPIVAQPEEVSRPTG